MTPAQHRAQLKRVIKTWKKRLQLDHYTITIEWDELPEDPDAAATISISEYYDFAEMKFAEGWTLHGIEELNRIVVHELMHILLHEYGVAARSIFVTGAISTDLRLLWSDRMNDAEEAVVDRLACRFVELAGVVK